MKPALLEMAPGPFSDRYQRTTNSHIPIVKSSLFSLYEEFLTLDIKCHFSPNMDNIYCSPDATIILESVREILPPDKIKTFLLTTQHYEEEPHYARNTGFFVSQLLSLSHGAGYD